MNPRPVPGSKYVRVKEDTLNKPASAQSPSTPKWAKKATGMPPGSNTFPKHVCLGYTGKAANGLRSRLRALCAVPISLLSHSEKK